MEAVREIGLIECLSEGIRITKKQSFEFMYREVWNQANIGTEIRNPVANIALNGGLDMFGLLYISETRGQRSAWKALSQTVEIDHG